MPGPSKLLVVAVTTTAPAFPHRVDFQVLAPRTDMIHYQSCAIPVFAPGWSLLP